MSASDQMLVRIKSEIDEKESFVDQLVATAQNESRDLDSKEMELVTRSKDRLVVLRQQLDPLAEASRIAFESRERLAQINADTVLRRDPSLGNGPVEYRSAGGYLIDYWKAQVGDREAREHMAIYHRAAAHQTTADNLGIIPEPIVGNVLNFIDTSRPIVAALGPQAVPGGRFTRPRVTQHTDVGVQSAEKAELVSRKMLITPIPVNMETYGGYVNVSRQNIDWSTPTIMDIVVNDLAGQYAIETEEVTATALDTAATAGPTLPANPTSADVAKALWTAAGTAFAAMQGQGRLLLAVSPDMLGLVGPLFAPVNPQNAQSTGFSAGQFGTGAMGAISGISVIMSSALPTGTMLVISTAAVEVYEQRIGALQVTEPSVLGVQVAYAGYFACLILEAAAVISITATP